LPTEKDLAVRGGKGSRGWLPRPTKSVGLFSIQPRIDEIKKPYMGLYITISKQGTLR